MKIRLRKFLFCSIFFLNMYCFSQSHTVSATYKMFLSFDEEIMKVDKKYGYLQNAIDVSQKMRYELTFKDKESNFHQVQNSNLDETSINTANSFANLSKSIYTNLSKKIMIHELISDGNIINENEFIVVDSIKLKWNITSESKMIGEYLCYKATTTKTIIKPERTVKENVTAWFCPKLPYSFGPAVYNSLPGLILELQEKNIAFVIENLNFNNEDNFITIPTAKKTISKQEYYDVIDNRFKMIEEMSKQNR